MGLDTESQISVRVEKGYEAPVCSKIILINRFMIHNPSKVAKHEKTYYGCSTASISHDQSYSDFQLKEPIT